MPISSPMTNPHQRHPLGPWSRDWADDNDDTDGDVDSYDDEDDNGGHDDGNDEDDDGSDNTK